MIKINKKILTFILSWTLLLSPPFSSFANYINDNNIKTDLVSNIYYQLSWLTLTPLLSTTNFFWCKKNRLYTEPFPIDLNSVSSVKYQFNKKNNLWNIFIKYTPQLDNILKLNNIDLLEDTIRKTCWKKISNLDKTSILKLENNLMDYLELDNNIINDYTNLYQSYKTKKNMSFFLNKFKQDINKILKLKKNLSNLTLLKIRFNKLETSDNEEDKPSIKLLINPINWIIQEWNKLRKLNYLTLDINRKHLKNIKTNRISELYIIWKTSDFHNFYTIKVKTLFFK